MQSLYRWSLIFAHNLSYAYCMYIYWLAPFNCVVHSWGFYMLLAEECMYLFYLCSMLNIHAHTFHFNLPGQHHHTSIKLLPKDSAWCWLSIVIWSDTLMKLECPHACNMKVFAFRSTTLLMQKNIFSWTFRNYFTK